MNLISQQFEQEFRKQEMEANKQSLMGFVWFFLAEAVVWLLTMINFFIIDKKTISITLAITLILFIPLIFIAWKGDLGHPKLKYLFLMLISITSSTLLAFLTFHATLVIVVPLIFSLKYHDKHTLWFTFCFNTLTMFIGSYIGFFYGLCDLNILLKDTNTFQAYKQMFSSTSTLTLPVEPNPAFIVGVFEVLPRTLILLIFTIMLRYTIVSNRSNAARIAELTYRKDTDLRTKLYNKSKFEEMATEYYPTVATVAVAFWDLNNLKTVNDRYGHAMGDALIDTLSSTLNAHSNERCRIFRVGGDEFLMILDNPAGDELSIAIWEIKQTLAKSYEQNGFAVSCAVGQACGAGRNIRRIVEEADNNMYEDKRRTKEEMK